MKRRVAGSMLLVYELGMYGLVEQVDAETWKFTADVYDASEMMPWLRTFLGRIVKLECSDASIGRLFREDLEKMRRLYGGEP